MSQSQTELYPARSKLNAGGRPKEPFHNGESSKLVSYLTGKACGNSNRNGLRTAQLIGVLPGCGIGPEVIGAALRVLSAVEQATGIQFQIEHGGPIGEEAE